MPTGTPIESPYVPSTGFNPYDPNGDPNAVPRPTPPAGVIAYYPVVTSDHTESPVLRKWSGRHTSAWNNVLLFVDAGYISPLAP
jgi:hypothetical protein